MISSSIDSLLILLISAFLIWFEYNRHSKTRLPARLIAIITLSVSLYFILYPPNYSKEIELKHGIILTDNVDLSVLDSLVNSTPIHHVISLKNQIRQYQIEPDISAIKRNFDQIGKWIVIGDGLRESEVKELSAKSIEFILNKIPDGIILLNYPEKIETNTKITIQGKFSNLSNRSKKLFFATNGQLIDSIDLYPKITNFNFSYSFKAAGKSSFNLYSLDSLRNTVTSETLFLPVYTQTKYSVLLLSQFPRFEDRQLKNWLVENQSRIAWRSRTSKVTFRFEAINRPRFSQRLLTEAFIKQFQIVIIHIDVLSNLHSKEKKNLEDAIRQNGLGLLIIWNKQFKNESWLKFRFVEHKNEYFTFSGQKFDQISDIKLKASPVSIKQEQHILPLFIDKNKHIVSAYHQFGLGKISLMMASDTYSLKFKEQISVYNHIWSKLIKSLILDKSTNTIQFNNRLNFANLSNDIILTSLDDEPEIRVTSNNENSSVYLFQSIIDERKWTGKFWSKKTGWHRYQTISDPQIYKDLYIYPRHTWYSYQVAKNQESNRRKIVDKQNSQIIKIKAPINRIWFFLFFLCSILFLWFEEKI